MSSGVQPIRSSGSTFTGPSAYERLWAAQERREGLTLTAMDVSDMVEELPGEDEYLSLEDIEARLSQVDVKALKVPVAARAALAEAFGFDVEDIWP